jgi:pyruvate formate lyase activating enzyme
MALDPIEKKPLYHFYPGSKILSLGSVGCNLKCPFCQNHEISMCSIEYDNTVLMTPESIIEKAIDLRKVGNIGIAYTYNEPTVWIETVLETARLAKKNNLKNVMVTNGYINPEPLAALLPLIDAMNIDLKSFDDGFYSYYLKGGLQAVKDTITKSHEYCHIEITTLIIPGFNDSREEMREISKFISNISPEIPLHLSRFFPRYKWSEVPQTTTESLYELAFEAGKFLSNVHIGNI